MQAVFRREQTSDGDAGGRESGFTLIELLVVMIIIGILAAIAIPVFLSQRQKARDTAARADASTIGKEIATYFVDNTAAPASLTVLAAAANSIPAGHYQLATGSSYIDLGRASSGIQLINYTGAAVANGTALSLTGMTQTGWCVAVADTTSGSPSTIMKYSAQNGLETTACSSVSAP